MKITIFGATGPLGREYLTQTLEAGHEGVGGRNCGDSGPRRMESAYSLNFSSKPM